MVTTDWHKSLDSLRERFRDVSRNYPKLFCARLIAPVVAPETWRCILGNKRYLRFSSRPLDSEYVDEFCLYAAADSDEIMCRHALQQLDSLAEFAARAIAEMPADIRQLFDLSDKSDTDVLRWLDVVDALAARPSGPDEVREFSRDQFRVLRNKDDPKCALLVPLLAYKSLPDSFPPDAFPHRWLAVLSPDVSTCSVGAINDILRNTPDPSSDFTIATWVDENGVKTTWTVHDPDTVVALEDSYGEPSRKFVNEGRGVSGTTLISRLDAVRPGPEDAHSYHQLIAQILNRLFYPDLTGMQIEPEINEGRKRLDICFDNVATSGFFHDLKVAHHIKCPVIFVECKNYTGDPGNPELDQLQGRFGRQRGEVGILVCRDVADRKTLIARCRDIVNAAKGYVIVLSDKDVTTMWNLRTGRDNDGFHQFLRDRMKELIL